MGDKKIIHPVFHLSSGKILLPEAYFFMFILFSAATFTWYNVLITNRAKTFRIHWLMGVLVTVKSLSLLAHSMLRVGQIFFGLKITLPIKFLTHLRPPCPHKLLLHRQAGRAARLGGHLLDHPLHQSFSPFLHFSPHRHRLVHRQVHSLRQRAPSLHHRLATSSHRQHRLCHLRVL